MSKLFTGKLFLSAVLMICLSQVKAQGHTYEIVKDDETKVLKGILTRSDIEGDTTFHWFKQNYALGTANSAAVESFKSKVNKFQVVVFGGTWCHDTQNLLPVFFRLADKAGLPESSISLIGVDRAKTTTGNLEKAFNVTNVPTFIVMQDGKEMGRVVEYGKEGEIDKELGEIVSSLK